MHLTIKGEEVCIHHDREIVDGLGLAKEREMKCDQ